RTLGRSQALFELVELGIEVNADGLEGASSRIGLLTWAETGSAADDGGELSGPLDRACGDNGAGDRPGARLLPIVAQDPGDLGLVGRIQIFGGGEPRLAHAHVERPVGLKGEAAVGAVELHRRNTDIERDRVDEI